MAALLDVIVGDVVPVARDVVALELRPADGQPLPRFEPGAHVGIHLSNGLVRHYSLYGDPADRDRYWIAVLRQDDSRGGSHYVHDVLRSGHRLAVEQPVNHFQLDAGRGPALLIAGGIGITPVLAMARELHATARPFELVYLARSREQAPFLDWLAAAPFSDRVRVHHSGGRADLRLDIAGLLRGVDPGTHVYCCGPSGLMDAVRAAAAHLAPGQLHTEAFAAEDDIKRAGDVAFGVRCARSKVELTVAADETILDVLLREGVDVDFSCQEGTCGTCGVAVLAGIPDHRDSVLSAEERAGNRIVMVCCSRARTPDLTLDL